MPAKVSCCTQQRSGLETDSFEQRTCWARLRDWEIHGCPGLLLWSRFPQGGPCCFPTMRPHYSCLGKGEPGGKWVPWTSLGEVWVGGGEHGGNGLLAVQMQCSFPSVTSELPTAGHLKAGSGLGQSCKALAGTFPWLLTEGPFWCGAHLCTSSLLPTRDGPGLC